MCGYVSSPNKFFNEDRVVESPLPIYHNVEALRTSSNDAKLRVGDTVRRIMKNKIHNQSREPALFLSSGLDSSTLAVCAPEPLNTYTIGFASRSWNENSVAKSISDACGHKHRFINFGANDLYQGLDDYAANLNKPYSHPNGLATFLAMKEIKIKSDLVFDGSGADEIMGNVGQTGVDELRVNRGEKASAAFQLISFYRRLSVETKLLLTRCIPNSLINKYKFLTLSTAEEVIYFDFWKGVWFRELTGGQPDLPLALGKKISRLSESVDNNFHEYYVGWAWEAAMRRTLMWQAHFDLEVSMPLATQEFANTYLSLPRELRFKDQKIKAVLYSLIRDKEPTFTYSKRAISTPWDIIIRDSAWRPLLNELPDRLTFFNSNYMAKLVKRHLSRQQNHGERLFNLAILAKFLEHHR